MGETAMLVPAKIPNLGLALNSTVHSSLSSSCWMITDRIWKPLLKTTNGNLLPVSDFG
jgi:hypothetical protein